MPSLKKKHESAQEKADIEAFMMMLVDAEKGNEEGEIPTPPGDLHHDMDYVLETWMQHKLHHTYPCAGGYDDQDELLMQDWLALNVWYIRANRGAVSYDPNNPLPEFPSVLDLMHD